MPLAQKMTMRFAMLIKTSFLLFMLSVAPVLAGEVVMIELNFSSETKKIILGRDLDDKQIAHYKIGYIQGKTSKEKQNVTLAEFLNQSKYLLSITKDLPETTRCSQNVSVSDNGKRKCYKVDEKSREEFGLFHQQVKRIVLNKQTKEDLLIKTLLQNPH